jgi:hypothetical protein
MLTNRQRSTGRNEMTDSYLYLYPRDAIIEAKAEGAAEERAKIVAWLMREEKGYPSTEYSGFAAMIREEIEAKEHLCWLHDWTRWSAPYPRKNNWDVVRDYQQRRCTKCGKIEERML